MSINIQIHDQSHSGIWMLIEEKVEYPIWCQICDQMEVPEFDLVVEMEALRRMPLLNQVQASLETLI